MLYLIYSVVCHPVMSYLVFTQTALYLLRHKDLTNFFYIIPDTTGGFVQNEKSLRGLFGTISPQSLFSSPLNAQLFFLFVCRVLAVYADETVLNDKDKINYHVFKPVLFEFPTYEYFVTGEKVGSCGKMN